MPMHFRIGVLLLLAALLYPVPLHADDLPYVLEPLRTHGWRQYVVPWIGDADADGFTEIAGGALERGEICVMGFTPSVMLELGQVNLSVERDGWHMVEFLGWEDIDLDGADEFLVSYVKDDTLHLVGYGFTDDPTFHAVIAWGEDRSKEPWWDGKVRDIARVGLADGGVAWAVAHGADMDLYPRGVRLFDAGFDEVLWRVSGGAQWRRALCADVDGDGSDEVIATSSAPQNGASANGTSDDRSHVMVVDDTGEVLWLRALGGGFTDTNSAVGDLNGDGRPEIVTATEPVVMGGQPSTRVRVWDAATGDSLCGTLVSDSVFSLHMGEPEPSGRAPCYLSGGAESVYALEMVDDELAVRHRRSVAPSALIVGQWPLGPGGTSTLVVSASNGEVHVLDTELRSLAVHRPPSGTRTTSPHVPGIYRARGGATGLLVASDRLYLFELARAPIDVAGLAGMLGASLAALVALVVVAVPPARRGAARLGRRVVALASPLPPHERERLELAVLAELDLGSHNRLELTGPLRSLERLLVSSREDPAVAADVEPIIDARVEAWGRSVRPSLEDLILQLQRVGGHGEDGRSIVDALSALDAQVAAAADGKGNPDALGAGIGRLEEALVDVRRTLVEEHQSAPLDEIEKVLEATEPEREAAGVGLERKLSALEGVRAWVSPRTLQLVITNLVSNAVSAMRDAPERVLAVSGRLDGDRLVLDVADTGRGMTREEADSAFTYGRSSRSGGGAGLFRSQEMLEMYGGTIEIAETAPGEGTVFRVTVGLRASGSRS